MFAGNQMYPMMGNPQQQQMMMQQAAAMQQQQFGGNNQMMQQQNQGQMQSAPQNSQFQNMFNLQQ